MDLAMYRSYDPAIGRWWQADPIVKPWENPYAAMYNNPMNWSDVLGANPSDGGMRKDTTPEKRSISWENLYVEPLKYSSADWDDYTPASDYSPRDAKVLANAFINIWNGTVGTAQTISQRKVFQSVVSSFQGTYAYFKNASLLKVLDDFANEENADEVLALGIGASLGLAKLRLPSYSGGLARLLKAGNALDKGGFTSAGRALQKHGSRPGSAFPKATGNATRINAQGLAVLEEILTNPRVKVVTRHHARFGNVLEYKIPGGRGARFSSDGKTFIGFIEP